MQFSEMDTEVLRRLEETTAGVYFTQAQRKEAINDAYEELSDATEWNETSQSVNLTTSTYYDLSSVLTGVPLTVTRVYNTQTTSWLVPTTERELDSNYVTWEDATGQPYRFLIRGLWWLGVFPKAPSATGTLTVYYTAIPTALSADADTPSFPQEFHLALPEYALYDLLCQDGEIKKAQKYYESYRAREKALALYVKGRTSYDRAPNLLHR